MSTNLVAVPPELPVAALAELLAARGISAVPVVDAAGVPLGIVTEGDLICRLADEPRGHLQWFLHLFGDATPQIKRFMKVEGACARDVMSANLITVGEDDTAERIAQLMETRAVRRVLVIKDGRLAGIVSRADLLRALLHPVQAAGKAVDDATILRSIASAIREQPWVDMFWVYPDVKAGVVTLYGYARSETMREGLRVLVQGIAGVTDVQDRLQDMPLFVRAQL